MKKKPSNAELRRILYNEEMAESRKELTKTQEKIREKKREREELLNMGDSKHIRLMRKAGVPITAAMIKKEVTPIYSKELEFRDTSIRRLENFDLAYTHALYMRFGVIAFLVFLCIIGP